MTIRKKFILFIGLSVLFVLCAVLVLGYFSFFLPRLRTIGLTQANSAQQLAYSIAEIIDEKIRDFPAFLNIRNYEDKISAINSRYHSMSPQAVSSRMREMDERWAAVKDDEAGYREHVDRDISRDLERLRREHLLIGEVLITDEQGGLVASSGRTSDYYQADEEWWQKAYADGRGAVYVGEAEYDLSSGIYAIPMAFPIKGEGKKAVGVCKVIISISSFFQILENFENQSMGHVTLLNSRNDILFHSGVAPLSRQVPEFPEIVNSGQHWLVKHVPSLDKQNELLLAFAEIKHPWFAANQLRWGIIVSQKKDAAFRPLYLFLLRLAFVELLLLGVLIAFGFVFATMFVKPIEKLNKATEHVARGNLEHQVKVRTGDEIETLAGSFNKMTEALRRTNLERLGAEDELKKALTVKSEFMATVSHELKTPLTAIREGVQLIVDGSLGVLNADQKDCLEVVKGNIERLVRLINDILDLQRLESGRIAFHLKPNDLHAVVREVAQTMAFPAQKKGIDILLHLDKAAVSFLFDRDKIAQVLSNLLSNAVKFTDSGRVTVTTEYKKDHVLVRVEDTGIGIKPEDVPKLFQRFAQISSEEGYPKTGGTGLGLVISREIVSRHKGTIWIEAREKKGTAVRFTLPLVVHKDLHA
ncbi:MAG: sensor histidine kinase [Candidatus Omnitrophota bacterium]